MGNKYWEERAKIERQEIEFEYEGIKSKKTLLPKELWEITEENFNRWIGQNYYRTILDFLLQNFNLFEEWMSIWSFSKDKIINLGISSCLEPNKDKSTIYKYIIKSKGHQNTSHFISDIDLHNKKTDRGPYFSYEYTRIWSFVPYLTWIQFQDKEPHNSITNHQLLSPFPTSYNFGSIHEQITIFNGLELLKMGGITLPFMPLNFLKVKSFEFVNLNRLSIIGETITQNKGMIVLNSYVNNLTIKKSNIPFFTFINCQLRDLDISETTLERWEFINCHITGTISKSTLINVKFKGGSFSAPINDCRLFNVELEHGKNTHITHEGNMSSDGYKILKIAYNSQGEDKKASEYYVKEMELERKSLLKIYLSNIVNWSTTITKKSTPNKVRLKHISQLFLNQSTLISYFLRTINFYFWEYGRNPFRVFKASGLIIFLFSIFYLLEISHWNISLLNFAGFKQSVLISLSSFSTLGFFPNEIMFIRPWAVVLESIFGAVSLAAFIGSIANQKY